jgi:hypothetical protein
MTALAASVVPPEIKGKLYTLPVAAAVLIFRGALLVLDASGNAKPGTTATGLRAVGVADEYVDNSDGDAGDLTVRTRTGIFGFKNSTAGDAITAAEIGHTVYIVDDQTVAKTSNGGARSPAGAVRMIDQDGFVLVDVGMPSSIDGDLVASNNLSDVADTATARANLGANKYALTTRASNLVGADTKVYRVVSPAAGTLKKIHTVIDGALTTGDATLTTKINATNVTTGVVTITQAGSAAGDKDSATATGANTIVAGDTLSVTVGGTNASTTVTAEVTFEIET